ncbi:hypothetical protein [Cupriavidus basilensis]
MVYTEGADFAGEQFFDIKADRPHHPTPTETSPEGCDTRTELAAAAAHLDAATVPRSGASSGRRTAGRYRT